MRHRRAPTHLKSADDVHAGRRPSGRRLHAVRLHRSDDRRHRASGDHRTALQHQVLQVALLHRARVRSAAGARHRNTTPADLLAALHRPRVGAQDGRRPQKDSGTGALHLKLKFMTIQYTVHMQILTLTPAVSGLNTLPPLTTVHLQGANFQLVDFGVLSEKLANNRNQKLRYTKHRYGHCWQRMRYHAV